MHLKRWGKKRMWMVCTAFLIKALGSVALCWMISESSVKKSNGNLFYLAQGPIWLPLTILR